MVKLNQKDKHLVSDIRFYCVQSRLRENLKFVQNICTIFAI